MKFTLEERVEFVQEILDILGSAYRWDYSNVDGREIEAELADASNYLNDGVDIPSLNEWMHQTGIKEVDGNYEWVY